jgi:hypothetical protein
MSAQLESGVERRIESPDPEADVTLIVGVTDSEASEVLESIRQTGATIEDHLPLGYLTVSVAESDLEQLCELEVVNSVEIEGSGKTLSAQDF